MKKSFKSIKKTTAILLSLILSMGVLAGCSGSTESVSVQSVAELCGIGYIGGNEKFAGVVCAKSESTVKSDTSKTISEICVAEGDDVSKDQVLFTYDMSAAQLSLEKAQLELTQLQTSLADKQSEKTTLQSQAASAASSEQLNYTLQIQKCDTEIREYEYNISLKEREVQSYQDSLQVTQITAPIAGHIKSITKTAASSDSSSSSSSETASVTIVITESGAYRIMGYVNEENVSQISEGMKVTVHSRVNDDTWTGTISNIEWTKPESESSSSSSEEETTQSLTTTSKYPFYVELDSSDGLLLGQHVYLNAQEDTQSSSEIVLPSYYFTDVDGTTAYVWAKNSSNKLEKRKVTISALDEEESYTVESGLSASDYIAYPDSSLKEGQTCTEYSADSQDGSEDSSDSENGAESEETSGEE